MSKLIEIKFDDKRLKSIQKMLREVPQKMGMVMLRSINRTTTSSRAEIARQIAAVVTTKQGVIKKGIDRQKATKNYWRGELDITRRRLPLKEFKAKQTKKGVKYKIEKSGGRKLAEHAFIATMRSGHEGVFRRKGDGRLPIAELRGPSVGGVFEGAAGIAQRVIEHASGRLETNIMAQIKYILEKRRVA